MTTNKMMVILVALLTLELIGFGLFLQVGAL
jgi:hypothetical protein